MLNKIKTVSILLITLLISPTMVFGKIPIKYFDHFKAKRYEEALKSLADHVELLKTREGVRHAHHLYVVRLKGINRNRVVAGMETRGIGVGIHYRPVHLEPYYREKHGHVPGEFPVAEDAGERVLSLPFWPEINEVEILRVVETLGDVITECQDS